MQSNSNESVSPDMWFVEYLTPHDAYHHGVRQLLHSQQTAYQSMIIADTGAYGRALFLDGKIQTTEQDEPFYHEPLVHAPCVTHGAPENILILGGADGGAAREALRWKSANSVVVVDIDGDVVEACRKYLPNIARGAYQDERCTLIIDDALNYIQRTKRIFDVIICDLTDPMENSPSLSLFTTELFEKLHKKLAPNGAISIQAGPASLVESKTLLPRICATLNTVFPIVRPYQVFVPTYGSPLGMALATTNTEPFPSPTQIDKLFDEKVKGEFHVLDGNSFHAHFAMPRCVQIAIANEKQIFTSENTANAFGVGTLEQS